MAHTGAERDGSGIAGALDTGDPIQVLYACDTAYLQHAAASLASLLDNNRERQFDVLLVSADDLGTAGERFLRSFAARTQVRLSLRRFAPAADLFLPLPYHLTVETYLRFWIEDLLPRASRALYLDPDTIITGDIGPLWQTDLGGRTLGAVPIPGSTRPAQHGMPAGSPFFNAGVLLIDLSRWRQRRYRDVCLDYLRRHPERALDGDQDILNLCLMGDWIPLDWRWNVITPFYSLSHDLGLPPAEIERARTQARVLHFNGSGKPWRYGNHHPRRAEYWTYLQMTEWRDTKPEGYSLGAVASEAFRRVLPRRLKRAVRGALKRRPGLRTA